jgi:hypothetical protein
LKCINCYISMGCNYYGVSFKERVKIKWPCLCPHFHLSAIYEFLKNPTEELFSFLISSKIYAFGGKVCFSCCDLMSLYSHQNIAICHLEQFKKVRDGSSPLAPNKMFVSVLQRRRLESTPFSCTIF